MLGVQWLLKNICKWKSVLFCRHKHRFSFQMEIKKNNNKWLKKKIHCMFLFLFFFLSFCWCMTLQIVLKKRERERERQKIREPPPSSQEYECKALGCFLASCRGHCNGAAATWDIPHMTFIQGRALTDASKQLCGMAKKGSLVTLDKAGDYHINLRAPPPCWKAHRTSQCTPALPAASRLTAQWRKGEKKQADKMLGATCIHVFTWTGGLLLCVTGCSLLGVDEVYKLDDACHPCSVYCVLYTPPLFVCTLICSVCNENQTESCWVKLFLAHYGSVLS